MAGQDSKSAEQKIARLSPLHLSNTLRGGPRKETLSTAVDSSAFNPQNVLQNQEDESQKPQDPIDDKTVRQLSLPVSDTSDRTASIDVSAAVHAQNPLEAVEQEDQLPENSLDQKTSSRSSPLVSPRQLEAASIDSSAGAKLGGPADSHNPLEAVKQENQLPGNSLDPKTSSQSSPLDLPRQLEAASIDSSAGANVGGTSEINDNPEDTVEKLQKPQELPKSRTPSQFSHPLSQLPETESFNLFKNADSRKDTEIPGSWPVTSEKSPTATNFGAPETPSHHSLPIPSEIDGVNVPSHADAPVTAKLPKTGKSPKQSFFSRSSSSLVSKSSDPESVRALESGTEQRSKFTTRVLTALNERLTPSNKAESSELASPPGREEPSHTRLDSEKGALPSTGVVPSSLEATESSRTANSPDPLTPAAVSKNAEIPPSPQSFESPKVAGTPFSSNEQKPSGTANTLARLDTAGVSNNGDFSPPSKTPDSLRTANSPSSPNAFGPSNQAARQYSLKTIGSPRTRSIIPNLFQAAESPKTRNKRSMSNAVDLPNNMDVSSPLKRPGASRNPSDLSELQKRGSVNDGAASFGTSLNPATSPRSLSTPRQEHNAAKEEPEPGTPDTLAEVPRSSTEGQKLPVPKIHIERANDAQHNKTKRTAPRLPKIDKGQEGKLRQALTGALSEGAAGPKAPAAGLHSPVLPQIAENAEEPKTPKIKRRKLYIRKARNVAARKIVLDVALGRELAHDTKPALRRLAQGEPYSRSSQDHLQVRVRVTAS